MSGMAADLADVFSPFKRFVWVVLAVNVTLLVLSGFSVAVGDLATGAEVVLVIATAVNLLSLTAAVGVLALCRRYD